MVKRGQRENRASTERRSGEVTQRGDVRMDE